MGLPFILEIRTVKKVVLSWFNSAAAVQIGSVNPENYGETYVYTNDLSQRAAW